MGKNTSKKSGEQSIDQKQQVTAEVDELYIKPKAERSFEMIFSSLYRLIDLIYHYREQIIYVVLAVLGVILSIIAGIELSEYTMEGLSFKIFLFMIFSYFIFNVAQYLTFGFIFEYFHREKNEEKRKKRKKQMKKEIIIGIKALAVVSVFVSVWFYYVIPCTPFYNYYQHHDFNWKLGIIGFFAYFIISDIWFYWTHRLLHQKWFFRKVHYIHHQFSNPTGFAQIATHWFEAIVHGPCVFLIPTLVFPVHPALLISLGYMTGIYAIAAHDGRILDLNRHYLHHAYKKIDQGSGEIAGVNYGIFWGFWDYLQGTRYHPDTCVEWSSINKIKVPQEKEKVN